MYLITVNERFLAICVGVVDSSLVCLSKYIGLSYHYVLTVGSGL